MPVTQNDLPAQSYCRAAGAADRTAPIKAKITQVWVERLRQKCWHAIIGSLLVVMGAMIPAGGRAGSGPVTYAYDELGRLIAVVDGSGAAAQYSYDAVGNLVSITTPSPPPNVSIFTFTPNDGPLGLTVTIYGDGFSTTPSQNTVKFNGTTATVTASTIASITTSVPVGATTGPIQVTVGTHSATSGVNFTVTAN